MIELRKSRKIDPVPDPACIIWRNSAIRGLSVSLYTETDKLTNILKDLYKVSIKLYRKCRGENRPIP